ncbi:MAG: TonB-dependent receptor [Pseudomonadota bacterium]
MQKSKHKLTKASTRKRLAKFGVATTIALFSSISLIPFSSAISEEKQVLMKSKEINIPSAPLADSLAQLGDILQINIIAPESLVKGKQAPSIFGVFTVEQVLEITLEGTGLVAEKQSGNGVYVVLNSSVHSNSASFNDDPNIGETVEVITILGKRETGYTSRTQSGAAFSDQLIFDTPYSVGIITQELLIDQQIRGLSDITKNDPSIVVGNFVGASNDVASIRGFILDNSSSYRRESLLFQNQVRTAFENKAAVEIIKGPTSLRYGFVPPGGVINYVLKRPTDDPYRFAQLFGDGHGGAGVHIDLGGRNDDIGYRFNAVFAEEASFVDNVSGPRYLLSAFLDWQPTDNLLIEFESEIQRQDIEAQAFMSVFSFDQSVSLSEQRQIIDNYDPSTYLGQSWSSSPNQSIITSLGATYDLNDDWSIRGKVQHMYGRSDIESTRIIAGSLQSNGDYTVGTFFSPNEVRDPRSAEFIVEGNFETFDVSHNVAFGFAWSKNPLRFPLDRTFPEAGNSNIFDPVTLSRPSAQSGPTLDALFFNQRAFFVSDFITVTDWLKFSAALRWTEQENEDIFNATRTLVTTYKDDTVVPNFGVIINPVDRLSLYSSFSRGITPGRQIPPNAANSGFESNLVLDPAETDQFEIGAKYEVFDGAILTAAYFDITQPLPDLDSQNIFRYLGDQRHRGIEVTLTGDITDTLRVVMGGYTLDPSIENPNDPVLDGNIPAGIPELQLNVFVDYELPSIPGLALNAGIFHAGDVFADQANTFELDSYTRFDVGARYKFNIGEHAMTARLNIRNLSDEHYVEQVVFGGTFLFGATRTMLFSLATEF